MYIFCVCTEFTKNVMLTVTIMRGVNKPTVLTNKEVYTVRY